MQLYKLYAIWNFGYFLSKGKVYCLIKYTIVVSVMNYSEKFKIWKEIGQVVTEIYTD